VAGRKGRRRKQLMDDLKERREIERGNTRSHCVEKWLWKNLYTCLKTDYRVNE
jgi:hypothetical protein